MRSNLFVYHFIFLVSLFGACVSNDLSYAQQQDPNIITWRADAAKIYDTGFMHVVRKGPDGGVILWNGEVIENDSPGAGTSEKGVWEDMVWGQNRAKKILTLDDPRAHKATLFVFPDRRNLPHPLTVSVNGHLGKVDNNELKGWENARWTVIPVEWLKKGDNVIELSCPDAQKEEDGWNLQLARADEYADGGGDPRNVGKTSFKSTDGGKSWKESPFGPEGKDRAEWSVRLGLERSVPSGWLESPVIDLWRSDSSDSTGQAEAITVSWQSGKTRLQDDSIARARTIVKFHFSALSVVPPGTMVRCFIRKGTSPSPYSNNWEPYELVGEGASVNIEIDGAKFNRRFFQFRMELTTQDPMVSPSVKSAELTAVFNESFPVPLHKNVFMVESDNPPVKYPSVNWEWEKWDRPEFTRLREQENLDALISGCRTELEAQMKLLDYAAKRWRWTNPNMEYPGWDALSIVDRINKSGGGGMCIQENLFLVGMCQAYGWQGRLIGVDGHEVCEIWNDEYAKWIYFDAFFPNHILCDPKTGEPLSFLELHNRYLDYFYPDTAMDWDTTYRFGTEAFKDRADKPPVMRSSLTYHDHAQNAYTGFMESRTMRMIPRNNFYEKPTPRPLSHYAGGYFWQGYVSWYDAKTPMRGWYRDYTDRPRDLWPDLNTVHINTTQGSGNENLFLEFETYTPNFSHFEVNVDHSGWKKTVERWTWHLVPGMNVVEVRSVSKMGVGGKPSQLVVNYVAMPLNEWDVK